MNAAFTHLRLLCDAVSSAAAAAGTRSAARRIMIMPHYERVRRRIKTSITTT